MSARCSFAPFPIYTGNPLPVILLPKSKSIKLYFFARSQCGAAPAGSEAVGPPVFTTTLSSGVLPSGTGAPGKLGSCNN